MAEFESLAEMNGVEVIGLYRDDRETINIKQNPLVYVNLPSDQVAIDICARSVLIKEIINVLAESQSDSKDDF